MEDNILLRKLYGGRELQNDERRFLEEMQTATRTVKAGEQFWSRGDRLDRTFVIRDGWMIRYMVTRAGSRQIISIALPGDILALHVNYHRTASYDMEAITDCEVNEVPQKQLDALYRNHPRLAAALNWSVVRDHAVLAQHIVSLGRRDARERMLFVFLELWHRLTLVGKAWDHNFPVPLTQTEIGDWLGLSIVHINRTIRSLEAEGLIRRESGAIILKDVPKMQEISDYSGDHIANFALA